MKSSGVRARWAVLLAIVVILAPTGRTQTNGQLPASTEKSVGAIRSIRAVPGFDGSVLEIISDHPLVPVISKLDDPPRLIIDLANARVWNGKKRIAFRSQEVAGVRIGQFQDAVARIVVDLAQPVRYAWDAAGNRLMIRLHAAEDTTAVTSFPAFTSEAQAAVTPLSAASSGGVVLAGTRLAGGSSVTAGSDAAVLRLGRSGEVRVCPGTTVSVTPSQNGRSLMLGMSTGAMEAHYTLDASSDSILTPDFRIVLAGPGEFHYGISADPRGNTCVQALPGNTASVIVSEVLGDGTYQVNPTQQVVFHSGQLKTADSTVPGSCGGPAPVPAIMRASDPSAVPEKKSLEMARSMEYDKPSGGLPAHSPETAALPASRPDEVHVQVDVPFVFRASDLGNQPAMSQTVSTHEAARLAIRQLPPSGWLQVAALPPPQAKTAHHGFFAKVRGFFTAIFS
jgi:hypothetical protein